MNTEAKHRLRAARTVDHARTDPGPEAHQSVQLGNNPAITLRTPAAHVAVWGDQLWAWTGTRWRPAMNYETDLARELVVSLRRGPRPPVQLEL